MKKRRTRKEKQSAEHKLTISWEPTSTVKSQKPLSSSGSLSQQSTSKNSVSMGLDVDLASIKKDLVKSLSFASFIILFELVIYFFWK